MKYTSLGFFVYIKLHNSNDLSEVDFLNQYAKFDFYKNRLY
jgi:hypothetical protein